MAGKIPTVQRCAIAGGLTGSSAYEWAKFLAEEYDMDSTQPLMYDVFKAMEESLEPKEGKPVVACFSSSTLEKEIKKWTHSTDSTTSQPSS